MDLLFLSHGITTHEMPLHETSWELQIRISSLMLSYSTLEFEFGGITSHVGPNSTLLCALLVHFFLMLHHFTIWPSNHTNI